MVGRIRRRQVTWLFAAMVIVSRLAFAQATSTFDGRIVDQTGAVLPGVTVTATNVNTGVVRTTVTNAEGAYSLPGLIPGVYNIKAELTGFGSPTREQITLPLNTTLTVDLNMTLGAVSETLTVTAEVPLVEVTQSTATSRLQAEEVENLPQVTRNFNGLLLLLPGTSPTTSSDPRRKAEMGGVSFGGSTGRNLSATVDGADNKDYYTGGMIMSYTQEAISEFKLATNQFSALEGRTAGAAISIVTKSGSNSMRGTGFFFNRNKALMSRDHFVEEQELNKPPFNRTQYGGSLGGPIARNRAFFFAAAEGFDEDLSSASPVAQITQLQLMVPYGAKPVSEVQTPFWNALYSVKGDINLNQHHTLMLRFAGQNGNRSTYPASPDTAHQEVTTADQYSFVAQHGWFVGRGTLNELTVQYNNMRSTIDTVTPSGELFMANFGKVTPPAPALVFPTVSVGTSGTGSLGSQLSTVVRNTMSMLVGNHSLKLGGMYARYPEIGSQRAVGLFGSLSFFHDPSVILSNSNGQYPQGLATPGAVRQISIRAPIIADSVIRDASQAQVWFQDDWRMTSQLTLNLGVRYDRDFNWWDNDNLANNATYQILNAIGSPYGASLPELPKKNVSPRLGFAYDLSGDGRRVLRGGYGLYFDEFNGILQVFILDHNRRPFAATTTLTNTAVGVGAISTFRYGIDPLPAAPAGFANMPVNTGGQWMSPDFSDPYNHQYHLGYAHQFAGNTLVSVDYTRVEGRNGYKTLEINPLKNGVRVLRDTLIANGYPGNQFAGVTLLTSTNRSRYDGVTFQFKRRIRSATLQAHYTLARANAYGGQIGPAANFSARPQDSLNPFAEGEWGPTTLDERHRFVAFGVFELPYEFQVSPSFQIASPRPYNLTAGTDLNADGVNNDRYIDPATGQQVSVNSARGDKTAVFDIRATKFFDVSGRRIGVFIEGFNLFNTVNFGNSYNGTATSVLFKQPTDFIQGIGYPRQFQIGARILF
jgi:hypothetical protein